MKKEENILSEKIHKYFNTIQDSLVLNSKHKFISFVPYSFVIKNYCGMLICSVVFQMYSKVNQLCIYIYPLFIRFFSHIGHYRVLSRVPPHIVGPY